MAGFRHSLCAAGLAQPHTASDALGNCYGRSGPGRAVPHRESAPRVDALPVNYQALMAAAAEAGADGLSARQQRWCWVGTAPPSPVSRERGPTEAAGGTELAGRGQSGSRGADGQGREKSPTELFKFCFTEEQVCP